MANKAPETTWDDLSSVLKHFFFPDPLWRIVIPYTCRWPSEARGCKIKASLTASVIQSHTLLRRIIIMSLKRSSKRVWKQLPAPLPQFKHPHFWKQNRQTSRRCRQVLRRLQKVNPLSLAAFNSQQHFVLGLCQVILGCEIVRDDGWLSAFCCLLAFSAEICGCWLQSKSLFPFFAQHSKLTTVIMREPTLQLF